MTTDKPDVFTVSEVSRHIRNVIESNIPNLFVEGEIANFTRHSSGHMYFSLKDEQSTLRCVFFKTYNLYLNFKPKDGDKVICTGKITVFEKGGSYQLNVTRMLASGLGDLQQRFEELKSKLAEEGLFDPAHKKPIPQFPESIGVVTSATGAAIEDIRNVLSRRFPVKIYLYPAVVQGDLAPQYIIEGIRYFNEKFPVDLLIVGRGGGSQEDLFCFNDEQLARTIYASEIPLISAVGHEIDFTIADFVADLRAPTPSAAAELAVPERNEVIAEIESKLHSMQYAVKQALFSRRLEVHELEKKLREYHPQNILQKMHQRLEASTLRLSHIAKLRTKELHSRLSISQNQLKELSPQEALQRGYAFLRKERKLVHSIKELHLKDKVEILLADGQLEAELTAIKEDNKDLRS